MIAAQLHHDRGSKAPRSWNSSTNLPSRPIACRGDLDGSDFAPQCLDGPLPRHCLRRPSDGDLTLSEASTRRPVIAEIAIDRDRSMSIVHSMKIRRSGSLHVLLVMCQNPDGSHPSDGD